MSRMLATLFAMVLLTAVVYAGAGMFLPGILPFAGGWAAISDVPTTINHQGVVSVNGVRFTGTGLFRFAIVDPDTGNNVWTNSADANEDDKPDNAVSLTVTDGVYSVALGDTSKTNMAAVPASLFSDGNLRLRVWFDDGTHGSEQLSPDYAFGSSPYAFTVADGAVTTAKLASDVAVVPSGSVIATGRSTAPAGWLLCDGAAVSRTTYADLFAAIGTTYGTGDGSTTFNLPDLRQRFPLGKANSGTGATLGSTGGTINYTHSHPLSDAGQAQITMSETGFVGMRRINASSWTQGFQTNVTVTASSATRSSGAALAGDTDNTTAAYNPPFLVLNYIIKN